MPLFQSRLVAERIYNLENTQQQEDSTQTDTSTNTDAETVSKSEFERVMKDLHKFKDAARQASEKLKTLEEAKLKEKDDWKTLAERYKGERDDLESKYTGLSTASINEKKFSAVERAALQAGIRKEALADLEMLNVDGVVAEATSTGKLNILGAEDFIKDLKQKRPHWFGSGPVKVDSSLPGIQSEKEVTADDLIKLSLEASKTGDYSKYTAANNRFLKQKK